MLQWDDGHEYVTVYTLHVKVARRLRRLGFQPVEVSIREGKVASMTFLVPKECIRLQKPATEEQRRRRSELAQKRVAAGKVRLIPKRRRSAN